jgi:serine phosphatase RsbU (regulator of sigma subunit)/pSer/pThr/pTyr-binding forkhead associated (FHA) protein
MAHLIVRRGANPGHRLPLEKDTIILGRSPDCDISIPSPSISRQHARLVRVQDKWYIEDMLSRNGTAVNGQVISARTLLKRNDRIRICDFEAVFQDTAAPPTLSYQLPGRAAEPEADELESSSTLTAIATHGNKVLDIQPMEHLRTILEVNNRFIKTLELDQLLPRIADSVFELFKQADRCFIILREEATGNLSTEVTRTRQPEDEEKARPSRHIVRQCLETKQAYLNEDTGSGQRPADRSSVEMAARSVMCTPFFGADNQPFGAIQLDTRDQTKKFLPQDLKLLVGLANQASIALHNALLYQEMQKREQMERDLELAAQVQRSILPERLPEVPGYQFYKHYASALEVGGDYFDFISLPQQRLAITLGDVAGKSVPAAILMAKLSSDVRTCLLTEVEPAAALTTLNRMLYRTLRQTDRWITFLAALLDPACHVVTLVNAGHCTPLLQRYKSNSWVEGMSTDQAGVPLGVDEVPVYGSCQLRLEPGDCLLMYTDGVIDAQNAQNQQFKTQGIYTTLRAGGPYTPQLLGERLVKVVEHHSAGRSQYDDITLVSFGRST